jgi:hypothetical protein
MTLKQRIFVLLIAATGWQAHAFFWMTRITCPQHAVVLSFLQLSNSLVSDEVRTSIKDPSNLPNAKPVVISSDQSIKYSWSERVGQLRDYLKDHGHTIVPKRYPGLGNWVNKQRQSYRRKTLTKIQIDILDELDFCWDASNLTLQRQRKDTSDGDDAVIWWKHFDQLKDQLSRSGVHKVALLPQSTSASQWIDKQRQQFFPDSDHNSTTTGPVYQERFQALQRLDPDWNMTRRQLVWEMRYQELLAYQQEHGDLNVPISYNKNKQLANWVSNQRKQFNRMQKGKPSTLTEARLRRLEAIHFVWNRWDDAFAKRVNEAMMSNLCN